MTIKWQIEKNFIFGLSDKLEYNKFKLINQIYIFDLDYTLIKTKSGKKFPINKNDWVILYPNISLIINKLENCLIGIISNQKGLKTQEQKNDWIEKLENIAKIIKIDFIFCSTQDDRYRKPLPGSIEIIKEQFINIDWKEIQTKNKIYYIGDAFGRKNDFSDTDIKFAINCGFKYKTTEIFFKIKNSDKTCNITYPIINYFSEKEQNNLFEKLKKLIDTNKKILIMMIGLPASGKSFLRKELIKKFPQFVYSNNDDKTENIQSKMLIKNLETTYDYIIDDNTNLSESERINKLQKFKTHYKIGIWFNYDLEICWHFNWMRMYWFGAKLFPKVIYYTLNKKFNSDNIDKDFDDFIEIDKVFKELNLNNNIKYYF